MTTPIYDISLTSKWQNVNDPDYQGGFNILWKHNDEMRQQIIELKCKNRSCNKIIKYSIKNMIKKLKTHRKDCPIDPLNNLNVHIYQTNKVFTNHEKFETDMIPSNLSTSTTSKFINLLQQSKQKLLDKMDLLLKLKDNILHIDNTDLIGDLNNDLDSFMSKIPDKKRTGSGSNDDIIIKKPRLINEFDKDNTNGSSRDYINGEERNILSLDSNVLAISELDPGLDIVKEKGDLDFIPPYGSKEEQEAALNLLDIRSVDTSSFPVSNKISLFPQ